MKDQTGWVFSLKDMAMAAYFFATVPFYLRRPLSLHDARKILKDRIDRRIDIFLTNVRSTIYGHPTSPYLPLLQSAGCTFEDLKRGVHQKGLEATLTDLFREGVYLTVDEFKGRRPVLRGNTVVDVSPELLRNPCSAYRLPVASGGSRTRGTSIFIDFRFVRGCAVNCSLFLDVRGGSRWPKATWEVSGAGARFRLMKFASFDHVPVRWFSQVDPNSPTLHPIFRWNTKAMRWSSLLSGKPLPHAIHAPLMDPTPVAKWMSETLQSGHVPFLFTFPSSAVAMCRTALDRGINIQGAQLTLGGEPITSTRLATIKSTGCEALPRYGSMECGPIGYGCLQPEHPDEVHILEDLHAIIQAGVAGEAAGLPPSALMVTSLHPFSPFILLNVSMGDYGYLEDRKCGCPLEADLKWTRHLYNVRSFEKLTGCGVTFLEADIVPILEEVLPSRFGGSPTDYQLCEEETDDGQIRLVLIVHPSIGPLNSKKIADVFLASLSSGSVINSMMERIWRESKILQVERKIPITTASGKVLHFHLIK